MNWTIEITPSAEKSYKRLDRQTRQRVKKALLELQESEFPLSHPNVRALTGHLRGDYRLRVGKYRILFTPGSQTERLHVYAVLPRGNAY